MGHLTNVCFPGILWFFFKEKEMRKVLLSLLLIGGLATSAFAQCDTGSIVNDINDSIDAGVAPDATVLENDLGLDPTTAAAIAGLDVSTPAGQTAAKAAVQAAADNKANTGTNASTAAMATASVISANISPAGGVSMGSGLARGSVSSVSSMAAVGASGYDCGFELWINPFAVWADEDADGNFAGYDLDVYGFNLGLTKRFDNFYVGAMFGYAYTDFDSKGGVGRSSFDTDNYTLALYGGFSVCNFNIDLSGGYTWTDYEDYRYTTLGGTRFNVADRDGHTWFFNIKASYDFDINECWTITPSIAWQYADSESDGFQGRDAAGNLDTYYLKSSRYSSRLPLMLQVTRNFSCASVFVRGGYIREFNDDAFSSRFINGAGNRVSAFGRDPGQNFGTVGAGISGNFGRVNLGLTYDYEWNNKDYDSHTVNFKAGIKF